MKNRRKLLKRYFIGKLVKFGCPDSYLEPTSNQMVNRVMKIIKQTDE